MISGGLGICSPLVFAEGSDKDYWTVAELLTAKPIIDSTKDDFCGSDNWDCRDGVNMAYRGLRGRAGGEVELESIRFAITSINPSQGTIKAAYFGENLDYPTWSAKHFDLTELYIFWVDDSLPRQATQATWNSVKNGEDVAGVHTIVSENEGNNPHGWFPEGQEITFSVGDISDVPYGEFNVFMNSERGNMYNTTTFSSCIDSPEYQEGMECRLVYSNDTKWFKFIPMDPATADYVDYDAPDLLAIPRMITIENIIESTNLVVDDQSDDPQTSTDEGGSTPDSIEETTNPSNSTEDSVESKTASPAPDIAKPTTIEDTTTKKANDSKSSNSTKAPITPNTGVVGNQSYVEFSIWFAPLLTAGAIALAWLFWPNHHRNHRK